ncbi:MAG TPA: isoleucine--tRNA ligase [Planctomycetota bacterium]|nr:isoleucine--tRNA ligase [Planctomycetota bacterium]
MVEKEKKAGTDATLNLPHTDFPMKADLTQREPQIREQWARMKIYDRIRAERRDAPKYVLHDGPPYANGEVHIGTALNKVLKDIVVKYKTMRGYWAPYVPGWDCHGLPIEHKVSEKLGVDKARSMPPLEVRKLCREFAEKYLNLQRRQFQALGVFGDWERPYLTMNPEYEAGIYEIIEELLAAGHLYRGLKPIHWCVYCRTALAEAELEYKNKTSPSIYVRFPLVSDVSQLFPGQDGKNVDLVVWTTTPWTLPADLATVVHPKEQYILVEYDKGVGIVAEALKEALAPVIGIKKVLGKVKGDKLKGLQYKHPLFDWKLPILTAEYVTMTDGTGLVHTAPGHGAEDFFTGIQNGLEILSPVDAAGKFTDRAERFKGLQVFEANPVIIEDIRKSGVLIRDAQVSHSYPHCWRCKKPVIFRATEQWFISVDKNDGRKRALEWIEKVHWVPDWGKTRISSMVQERPDWCISRQRTWGVPIPAFYCEKCNELLFNADTVRNVKHIVAQEGTDAWFAKTAKQLLPRNAACAKCGSKEFRKETDIVDVWLESACSHRAVSYNHADLKFPADLYLEGTDQHRGWFQVSLLASVFTIGKSPFSTVVTHGFITNPETGEKQSKSGIHVPVEDVFNKLGTDILRLWLASVNFTDDMPMSWEILQERVEPYRKIRNTLRFLLGNTSDFDPRTDRVPPAEMRPFDRWLLIRLNDLVRQVTAHFEAFEFYKAYHKIFTFCDTTLSSIAFDALKGRLYTAGKASPERRSAQTALSQSLSTLLRLLAPILVHTTEEAWQIFKRIRDSESVHLAEWPAPDASVEDAALDAKWQLLSRVRDEVNRRLEALRQEGQIGKPVEAVVELHSSDVKTQAALKEFARHLDEFFIVSEVRVLDSGPEAELTVKVSRSAHPRCERCWLHRASVGSDPTRPGLCAPCAKLVGSLDASAS